MPQKRVPWAVAAAACFVAAIAPPSNAQTPSPDPAISEAPIPEPDVSKTPVTESEPETVYVDAPEAPEAEAEVVVPEPDTPPARSVASPPASNEIWWTIGYRRAGSFTTARLQSLIARLRAHGMSESRLNSYSAPFIVAGDARFWDSWGEVRRATHGLRPHLGQDVFCDYGAPVLASENGTIEFGSDAAGGLVARLYRGDGSYWYYAHLSNFGKGVSSGDRVSPGDVIGHCGTSGNAAATPPHVHFGLYVAHAAQNPVDALVGWLMKAETRARNQLRRLNRYDRPPPETASAANAYRAA